MIEGGQEFSSYPRACLLKGERRTIPGETARCRAELPRVLGTGATIRPARSASRSPAIRTSSHPTIVELVSRHAGGPEIVGAPYWADSALLSAAGIPTVLFGPGRGAHAVEEWVDLGDRERCAEIYAAVARELCA